MTFIKKSDETSEPVVTKPAPESCDIFAFNTPGVDSSTRCNLLEHPPQVIPEIDRLCTVSAMLRTRDGVI